MAFEDIFFYMYYRELRSGCKWLFQYILKTKYSIQDSARKSGKKSPETPVRIPGIPVKTADVPAT